MKYFFPAPSLNWNCIPKLPEQSIRGLRNIEVFTGDERRNGGPPNTQHTSEVEAVEELKNSVDDDQVLDFQVQQ